MGNQLNIVKWAINKELPDIPKLLIDWYEVEATKQPTRSTNSALCEYLNSSHPMYSEELAAAIETWESVLQCNPPRPKTGSRKSFIEKHLKDNYSTFNKSQRDRITLILNPDKGGAPKST